MSEVVNKSQAATAAGPSQAAPDAAPAVWPLIRRTLGYAKPYLWVMGATLVFVLIFAAGRYGRAYLLLPTIDDVVIAQDPEAFRRVAIYGLLIALAMPIGLFGREYLMRRVLALIQLDIQREVAAKLMRLPLSSHRGGSSGDTLSRAMVDAEKTRSIIRLVCKQFMQAGVSVIVGMITMFMISWQMTLTTLIALPLIGGTITIFAGRVRRSSRRRQAQLGEVAQRLTSILSGIKVIKAFRGEGLEAEAFARETRKLFQRQMKVDKNSVLSRSLVELLNAGMLIIVLLIGARLVGEGMWEMTPGKMIAFFTAMAGSYKPIKVLSRGWPELMESSASAERLFGLLDMPEEPEDPPDAVAIDGVHKTIHFENLGFSYGREHVLNDISVEIQAGEVVAIVGPTGSGKTTIVDLLLRFYDPTSGAIRFDGRDIRQIKRDSLLDKTAVVTQEPFLFDTTIRENIRYGRPNASEEEFMAAVRVAHVDEFVDQLTNGFDTQVGEFGMMLSGGQRQRITIARAILRDPAILVFDEATSALDAKTERTVQEAIDTLRGERTVFVIAHRLSTIRYADRILVLERGQITQSGSHEALMAEGGLYSELVALQRDEESRA